MNADKAKGVNPLISEYPGQTLENVVSGLRFIEAAFYRDEGNSEVTLNQSEIEGLFQFCDTMISALKYEADKKSGGKS